MSSLTSHNLDFFFLNQLFVINFFFFLTYVIVDLSHNLEFYICSSIIVCVSHISFFLSPVEGVSVRVLPRAERGVTQDVETSGSASAHLAQRWTAQRQLELIRTCIKRTTAEPCSTQENSGPVCGRSQKRTDPSRPPYSAQALME